MTFIALKLQTYVQVMKLLFGVTDLMAKLMSGRNNHHQIISHLKDQLIPLLMQTVETGKKLKRKKTTLKLNQFPLTRLTSWFWWEVDSYCFSCYHSAAVFAVVYAREEERRKRKKSKLKQRWQEPSRDVRVSSMLLTEWLEKIKLLDNDIFSKDPVRKSLL